MTTGHEEEFRRLFADEAAERLAELAEFALELDRRGSDPELLAGMFRHAHTLKGGAGVVGFTELGAVLHELEELLAQVRDGARAPSAAVADAVLGAVDALRDMVARAMTGEDQEGAALAARAALARADGPPPATEVVRAAPAPVERAEPPRAERESIPVPVARLDTLVRLVGEGAAAQLRVGRAIGERLGTEAMLLDEYRELTRVLHDLQEGAMRARMVSVATMARPLSRAARELARDAGKQVELEVVGEETELDRHVLEGLREPLVALVRNAVDHGIELPAERMAAGKPAVGRVRVHAMQIAGDVIVSVADDGRGIDLDRVRARLPDGRGMSDDEALEALFRSGVSTADRVTGVSGRGVGLDAVRAAVDALRGRVEVRTAVGAGSEFRIRVPLTLAIQRCVVVEAGGSRYAIPLAATVALVAPSSVEEISAEGRPAVWFGGEALPVSDLAAVVGTPAPPARGAAVVLSTPAGRHALRVDAVRPQRDVVVKALGRHVPRLDLVAGASAEPDGTAMVVLDATGLIEAAATAGPLPPAPPELAAARASRGRVLVVDDALTVRELQRSILERAGYQVRTAPGGAAALALLEAETVDLVLTDVEMPGMDGFALTQAIRADPARAGLPVVILTSREDDSDRRRGMEAGADGYLVKSTFDEHALVTAVARLLGEGADR